MRSDSLQQRVLRYLDCSYDERSGAYVSHPGGAPALAATAYAVMTRHYLRQTHTISHQSLSFLLDCQDAASGYFIGPELADYTPAPNTRHDRDYLMMHITCAVLPALQQSNLRPRSPVHFAQQYCDLHQLNRWLGQRDWTKAWLEGNRLLIAGQSLIFLRDVEGDKHAQAALDRLFDWLDEQVDPRSGLWGTDRGASAHAAMCGAYHQLLLYYHEQRPVKYAHRLIDTVLSLQHEGGGFRPEGGGGACEDVDAIDILVNLYKQCDYRRDDICAALHRCHRQIRSMQNSDGGFAYNRVAEFSHNGIPVTRCAAGTSNMFSTWFRLHTIALVSQIISLPEIQPDALGFSSALSMGWHRPWNKPRIAVRGLSNALGNLHFQATRLPNRLARLKRRSRKLGGRVKRRIVSLVHPAYSASARA